MNRWVPIDPTFDQVPASALRIRLGDTDLADLGGVGWETAATALSGVRWIPEKGVALAIQGDTVSNGAELTLRFPKGRWTLEGGGLQLRTRAGGPWQLQAVCRPGETQLKGSTRMAGARTLRSGWWSRELRQLWMDLGAGRWIQVDGVSEAEAYELLDQLTAPVSSS